MELTISENIKRLRKARSMTQEQLAEALGVTTGAVYKWENSLATPEIKTIMELADFFEVSIDVLLGYTLQENNVDAAVHRIVTYRRERKFQDSVREAEKALQKYPNHFKVVFQSAQTYYLISSHNKKAAHRCIELLRHACRLIDQNPYPNVSLETLQESIATCHIGLEQYDKCIELLKKLNTKGTQNPLIGMVLSMYCHKPEEALSYLSDGLDSCLSELLRIIIGYADAYTRLGQYDAAVDIIQWALAASEGLRDTAVVNIMDKASALFLAILADTFMRKGDISACRSYLKRAKETAARFDASPEYRSAAGMKFYHGSRDDVSLDDIGDTAKDGIENHLSAYGCERTCKLWEEVRDE